MADIDFSQMLLSLDAAISGKAEKLDLKAPTTLQPSQWPPDYASVIAWRNQQIDVYKQNPQKLKNAIAYYSILEPKNVVAFINHWCWTYDPRNLGTSRNVWMPFILFQRQAELVEFILDCMLNNAPGLVEKSRDMGATWVAVAVAVCLWLFQPGIAIGFGSNKQDKVDVIGSPDSIFEKLRLLINRMPIQLVPLLEQGNLKQYNCTNPKNGAIISGEIGPNIGRGGRSRMYFVDEAAHLDKPEAVSASLSATTRCRIDISSVSGAGTVFHRTREAGVLWTPGSKVTREAANIFEMDWKDHPDKTPEWYAEQHKFYANSGLGHITAQEIDRDYFASLEGVVIQYEWVEAATDAHVKLGFVEEMSGGWSAGMDIADEGIDTNALIKFKGNVAKDIAEWGSRDPGVSARKALAICKTTLPIKMQYDCIGIGASVKDNFNRLMLDERVLPKTLQAIPWNAGGKVQNKSLKVIGDDPDSPTNSDFFSNFKAQAWWNVGQMFYKTFKAVTEGIEYDPAELISLDSTTLDAKLLLKLKKELCQAAMGHDARLKMKIDKAPDGTKSPNLADALIMCRYPAKEMTGPTPGLIGPKVFVGGSGL